MKVRRDAGRTAEKTKLMHSQKQRAAAGRATSKASGRASWVHEQAMELSRLVLGFARLSRRLPDAGDRPFWQFCHKRFNGVFTCKQMQAKVRYLHLRFRRLADGAAKTLHLAERNSVQFWTQIMHYISPSPSTHQAGHRRSTSSASTRSRSAASPSPSNYTHSGATHQDAGGRSWGAQHHVQHENVVGMAHNKAHQGLSAGANAGPASMKKARYTTRAFREHGKTGIFSKHVNGKSTSKTGCASVDAATGEGEAERAQEGSGCSTQMHEDGISSQENNNKEDGRYDTTADATTGAAPENETAILLHHATVADLSAAVKVLAEVVARGPGRK